MGKRVSYRPYVLAMVVAAVLGTAGLPAKADTVTLVDMGTQYALPYTTVGVTFNGVSIGQTIAGPEQWHRQSGSLARGG